MLDSSDIARRFAGIAALRGSCSLTEQEMGLLDFAQRQTERMNRVLQSPEQWPSHREAVERERKVFSKIGETLGRMVRCNEGRFIREKGRQCLRSVGWSLSGRAAPCSCYEPPIRSGRRLEAGSPS